MTADDSLEVIGIMPAAGRASRLGALPCSKEIFPVGFENSAGSEAPRPVCSSLLRGWAQAGIRRGLVMLRDGKWDIPAHLGDGQRFGLDLGYLVVEDSGSVPETLARATPWLGGVRVALGFPDIQLEPADAWPRLLDWHRRRDCDVSLGLFPTDQTAKADMVGFGEDDRITEIIIKEPECALRWTWSIAVWEPVMTRFLEGWVAERRAAAQAGWRPAAEVWVGDAIRSAIDAGLDVRGLTFPEGSFLDVGTGPDLRRAIRRAVGSPPAGDGQKMG